MPNPQDARVSHVHARFRRLDRLAILNSGRRGQPAESARANDRFEIDGGDAALENENLRGEAAITKG